MYCAKQFLVSFAMTFAPPVQHHVFPNGLTAIAIENPAADIVAARIFIKAGSLWEARSKAGLANLVAAVMTKGTERLSSMEIAERVESIGASLGTDASTDYFLVSLKSVSHDFVDLLSLAGELLRSPAFPESEVELERSLMLQGIRSQREQPFSLGFDQLRQVLYGPEHPYAFSPLGTETTTGQLTPADLQGFHQTYFQPDRVTIAVSGCLSTQEALKAIEAVFGDWQVSDQVIVEPQFPPLPNTIEQRAIAQETQQAIVMLGYGAASVLGTDSTATEQQHHPDYAALKLASTYLGNGLSSRLFVELREKRGLAYEVSALYPTRLGPSHFVVYMGTAPQNVPEAIAGLQSEVERLIHHPIEAAELTAAKNKLLGQYALGKQTNAQLAQLYGWYEVLGLGREFDRTFQTAIAQVSAQDIQTVADRYFAAPHMVLTGPATAVEPALLVTP